MFYKIIFHPKAEEEFSNLDGRLKQEVINKIIKLKNNPTLGKILGKKTGLNLFGCRAIYFDNKRARVVYKIIKDKIIIYILAIGQRDKSNVYKIASSRKIF